MSGSARSAPRYSIVTPVYEPPLYALRAAIESVVDQDNEDWELILVDDRSPSDSVRATLQSAAAEDDRIRIIERKTNGGIVAASNDGVAAARGEFIVLLDHDDLLVPTALSAVDEAVESNDDVDYIYSDEDKVDAHGNLSGAFRKPDWSPERLRHQMYTSHLSVLRTELVREVGGFHTGFDGSQDHDLALRVTERARTIVHIPEILYHWRMIPGSAAGDVDAKPYAWEAGQRAVAAHVERVGIDASVTMGSHPGIYRLHRRLRKDWRVSLVFPTRGGSGLIWGEPRCYVVEAVRSVLATTDHQDLEIVVVYDDATPDDVLTELADVAGDKLVLVPFHEKFNFSAKCNLGFLVSTGDAVILINDDIEAIAHGWLEMLVAPLQEPDVGMTGAHLLFSDGTLQHGGHAYARDNHFHAFYQAARDDLGPFAELLVNRECSGVTAGCTAIRRDVFDAVGGLSESLPINFNDVDLSRKVSAAGYRILWIADAELYHFESKTREPDVHAWEVTLLTNRWGVPKVDPYLPTL